MKKATLVSALALALATIAPPCIAVTGDDSSVDQQIALKQLETDQRAVYALNLGLTDAESRAFWPIYDEYATTIKKVTDQRLQLLNEYAAKYQTLSDADAEAMLAKLWRSEQESLRIRRLYAKKVQEVLPAVKALRYVQLQARIDYALQGRVISLVPLAH
ncbi:MAG: hypothetical protein NDI84_06900 [Steroidobacteraceae bacterium]|nr:hypothetical protein [Steroidobacteraceae bacterium]